MKEMTQPEIREAQLRLLVLFKDFCAKNKIRFFLFAGSLLGAVRHGGFIPWDNDIDLAVPRQDYERLKKLLKNENVHPDFRFLCFENNPGYNWQFGKVIDKRTFQKTTCGNNKFGLFVDIFPLDSQGNNKIKALNNLQYIHQCVLLRTMCYDFKYKELAVPSKTTKAEQISLLKAFSTEGDQKEEYWVDKIIQSAQSFSRIESPAYYGCNCNEKYSVVTKASVYSSTIDLSFEKMFLPAPIGYKDILKAYYGDYMKLPPENKRHGIDTTNLFWL